MVDTKLIGKVRQEARQQLKGNKLDAAMTILAQFSVCLMCVVGLVIPLLFAAGALNIGSYEYFYLLSENKNPKVSDTFRGFNYYPRNLLLSLARGSITLLWSILLVVPGVMVGLMYSQTSFIAALNPEKKVGEILKESADLTRGKKREIFVLNLSFIGWFMLSALTLGILLLWIIPYYRTTKANYYKHITKTKETN